MKRLSIQRAQEQVYLDVLRAKAIEIVDAPFARDMLNDAHQIAKRAARLAGRGLRSLRGQNARERAAMAQQSGISLSPTMADPFYDVFGCERRPDVAEYDVYFTSNGRIEEDAAPDFCAETLAMAILEAKEWIADDRAEEFLIESHDLPLLCVTKKGLRPFGGHFAGQAGLMEGIGRLLTWEQIVKPLFVDGPVLVPEKSTDDTSTDDDEEDALTDDDESEEP